MDDYLGMAGLILILAGWLVEFYDVLRSKKEAVPLSFAVLYGSGSLLLTIHSINIGDMVFVVLNAAAMLIAIANIAFSLARKKKKK